MSLSIFSGGYVWGDQKHRQDLEKRELLEILTR